MERASHCAECKTDCKTEAKKPAATHWNSLAKGLHICIKYTGGLARLAEICGPLAKQHTTPFSADSHNNSSAKEGGKSSIIPRLAYAHSHVLCSLQPSLPIPARHETKDNSGYNREPHVISVHLAQP